MRAIWIVLCFSYQRIGGYDDGCRSLITILNWIGLNDIQIKNSVGDYHMVWTGTGPNVMNTGPPLWLTVY